MAITNQSLADIKTSLANISSGLSNLSASDKAKIKDSETAQTLSKGSTSLSGTLTSEQARRTVANTQKESTKTNTSTPNGMNDAYSKLFAENSKLKQEFADTQAKLQSAQSGLSIADQQKQATEDAATEALLKGKKSSQDATDSNAPADASVGLEDVAGKDPILKAMMDSANEQRTSIKSQLDVLNRQMLDADDDTKFMIRQIDNLANQQIMRQEKANEQMIRGAKVAGLSAGIARYSPETHSGIVQSTINDGLALIQDIEFKAMEKKYQAKKDLRDFNYKGYLESQKLVTEYNDLKNKTIISMYEQIQKAETDAREAIRFDNEQADRNALIIAPELIDATPEQIAQAATANGIELGALMRAVNDAKFEQDSRNLDLENTRASIRSSNRANQPTEQSPKAPERANFGTSDTPDWRERNPVTGEWNKVKLGGEPEDETKGTATKGKTSKEVVDSIASRLDIGELNTSKELGELAKSKGYSTAVKSTGAETKNFLKNDENAKSIINYGIENELSEEKIIEMILKHYGVNK